MVLLVASACGTADEPPGAEGALEGLFRVTAGQCDDEGVTAGSYFRMVQSGGELDEGPFVPNGDSPCGDTTYTPLRPGADGGLLTGEHQPHPEPPFDDDGNGAASAITEPQPWFAVAFSLATNPVDPQTGEEVGPPTIQVEDGRLTGDLRALAAAWNGQHFNQGSPKPDGSMPGNTRDVTGEFDPDTGAFTLRWSSQIVGGPFNNFTGVWHLEGTFEPRS